MAGPQRGEPALADFGLRSRVYTYLLGELRLALHHREALRGRGIDSQQQIRDGYRTLTQEDGYLATRKLIEYFGREKVLEVPGFYEEKGEIYPTIKEGLAVPVYGLRGEIRAVQVRIGGRSVKYATLSGGPGGSVGTPCHVPMAAVEPLLAGAVWAVTEGPIKANVATDRWIPTVGVLGATAVNPVKRLVEKKRPKEIVLAFDMDRLEKPGVKQAQDRLAEWLQYEGVKVKVAYWNPTHKGLDDALVAGERIEAKPAEVARGLKGGL